MQVIQKLIEKRLIERFDRSILIFLSSIFTSRKMCPVESKLNLTRLFETFTETREMGARYEKKTLQINILRTFVLWLFFYSIEVRTFT